MERWEVLSRTNQRVKWFMSEGDVPEEVVEGWRRKGKPAPHDYDPKRDGG